MKPLTQHKPTITRILSPDVYDALELSALAYGGIGKGAYRNYDGNGGDSTPRCIIGHASGVCGHNDDPYDNYDLIRQQLNAAGIDETFNDALVEHALRDGVGSNDERISWAEYVKRANIVRGED